MIQMKTLFTEMVYHIRFDRDNDKKRRVIMSIFQMLEKEDILKPGTCGAQNWGPVGRLLLSDPVGDPIDYTMPYDGYRETFNNRAPVNMDDPPIDVSPEALRAFLDGEDK